MLKVDGIRVKIRGFIILRAVSFEIPSSGLVGLVGRNGAGKSTTLKSIIGIIPVSSGRIDLDGQDLVQVPGHRRVRLDPNVRARLISFTNDVEEKSTVADWARSAKTG